MDKQKRQCKYCHRVLVPIGHDRKNGKSHGDWLARRYHKKCYKELTIYNTIKYDLEH